ncbi:1552_t:CDS:2, partial [Scutellospora calospora]
ALKWREVNEGTRGKKRKNDYMKLIEERRIDLKNNTEDHFQRRTFGGRLAGICVVRLEYVRFVAQILSSPTTITVRSGRSPMT